jgi:hypothetical protein
MPQITASPRPARRIATFVLGTRTAKVYLCIVAANLALALAMATSSGSGEVPDLGWLYPVLVTMPWSLLMTGLPVPSDGSAHEVALVGTVLVSALANLVTLGALRHVVRRTPAQPQAAPTR